jgi:8-oxo-dGTP pyrophosphatase MutT (NUDIX family)
LRCISARSCIEHARFVVRAIRAFAALARLPVEHARNALRGVLGGRARERVVVQAVVRSERDVLLSLRSDLMGWELPGGNLRTGESEEAALVREVSEETGLAVELTRFVGEYRRTGFFAHRARVYEARPVGGALVPSAETPAVRWFATDALPRELFPWFRGPLADALRGEEPVIREERLGLDAIRAGFAIDLGVRLRGGASALAETPPRS